jgi:hypothetical protein
MPLSPRARAASAAERAVHDGNVRGVIQLADKWGLSAGDRINAVELDRRAHLADPEAEFALHFKISDGANVRTVSDVWRQGRSA